MARKKGLLSGLFSSHRKTSTKNFGAAMKILRSTKPTKLRNASARAGIFK